jgi:hypothetical protein
MKKLIKLISFALILLPALSMAKTDCRIVDHEDHVELICLGDEKSAPTSTVIKRSDPNYSSLITPSTESTPQGQKNKTEKTINASTDNPGAQRSFQTYLRTDMQRSGNLEKNKAFRMKVIQEELNNTPSPTVSGE